MKTLLTVMLLCTLANTTATGLSLEDVLREVHGIPDVRLAELDLAAASLAVADANRPTYPSLTVSPGVRVIGGSELTDISRVGLSATATLSVPLGSGEEYDVRSDALARNVEELEVAYADVRSRYIQEVLGLYHTTWLQYELVQVLLAEQDTAERQYSADRLRFERGEIALATLIRTGEALSEAESAVQTLSAERMLQLQRLAILTGLPISSETPQERPPLLFQDLNQQELSQYDVDLRLLDVNLLRRGNAYETLVNDDTPQPSLLSVSRVAASLNRSIGYGEFGATVGISPNGSNAAFSYQSPEFAVIGDESPIRRAWNASLTVSVSVDPNLTGEIAADETQVTIETARAQLQAAEDRTLEAEQRAAFDLQIAAEAIETARIQRARAVQTRQTVEVQISTGRATSMDELVADTALLRSEYLLNKARLEYEQAVMRANPGLATRMSDSIIAINAEGNE